MGRTEAQNKAEKLAAKERSEKLTAAYTAAVARLRDLHLKEFNELRVEEAKKRGIEWTPKPTEEEKAQATMASLLDEFPHLRDQLVAEGNRPEDEQPDEPDAEDGIENVDGSDSA